MESVWMEETKIRKREPLPGDMEVPVAVIGAGLAGILTAYYLKQAGIRAVVLEADRIGSGQMKNTTAKITSQHSLIYDRALRNKAREIYPGCQEKLRWSAQDCMTLDGLPYIGRFSRREPDWYVATGFGKWGMTTAMVSARILTALISGQDCQDADIFSPQRHFTARAAKELAVNGAYTVKGLVCPWLIFPWQDFISGELSALCC